MTEDIGELLDKYAAKKIASGQTSGTEYMGANDWMLKAGDLTSGSRGQQITPPPLAEVTPGGGVGPSEAYTKDTTPTPGGGVGPNEAYKTQQISQAASEGKLNQSPATAPQNYTVQEDGTRAPKSRVGGFRQVDTSSTNYIDRALSRQFSRLDTLDYGFTFELLRPDGTRIWMTLFINPEELTQSEPPRITVTQTRDGVYVDHFGQGIKQLNIRGVTGFHFRNVGGELVSGHQHFIDLRGLVRQWHEDFKNDPDNTELRFYNWTDEEYYEIAVTQFQLTRNTQRPLLYQYSIQMLVIQDITEKVRQAQEEDDISDYLIYPEKRAPLIQDKIDKSLKEVVDKVEKNVDLTRFSEGTQEWAPAIAKGKTYWNSINQIYEPIEDVISEVEGFSKDLGMYVNGATSFVTKPFELVRDMTISIGDVINSMVSVAKIPHELVRSFREMVCAMVALPESLFEGFTNPYLFDGASNCGTTLGIPEASVSAYNNSFTATSKIPQEREVIQEVLVPKSNLLIKEEPTDVIGVFLSSDADRTGLNYLDSWDGRQVSLTSVPNASVIIDYKVRQPTTVDMINLKSAKTAVVNEMDTLEKIALTEYGDASRWKEIALFNTLEYPFIVDYEFVKEIKATGSVRFYRNPTYFSSITIPAYTRVFVPSYRGTRQINFRTTEEKTLDMSRSYVDIPIEAEQTGNIGNVASNLITQYVPAITGISYITNLTTTSGGKIWKVLKPGDIIFIPSTEAEAASIVYRAELTYEQLFGLDVFMNTFGEMEVENERLTDVKIVSGTKNLVQALRNRIATVAGTYAYHSEYGSHLPIYIGKKNNPQWINLVKADVKQVCLRDPRISQLKSFKLFVYGDIINVSFDAIPINQNSSLKVNLIV